MYAGSLLAIKMFFGKPLPTEVLQPEEAEATQALPVLPSIRSQDSTTTLKNSPKKQGKTLKWSESEEQLLQVVAQRCHCNWKRVSRYFPTKHKSEVRRRWENKFDPNRKHTKWTEEEDEILKALIAEKGQKFRVIAKSLPGRPPDMVKGRYHGHIKRLQDIKDRKDREAASRRLPSWEEVCKKVTSLQSEQTNFSMSSFNAS